jgi:hypothetical protein
MEGESLIRPYRRGEVLLEWVEGSLWRAKWQRGFRVDSPEPQEVRVGGESFFCPIVDHREEQWSIHKPREISGVVQFGSQRFPVVKQGDHWELNER